MAVAGAVTRVTAFAVVLLATVRQSFSVDEAEMRPRAKRCPASSFCDQTVRTAIAFLALPDRPLKDPRTETVSVAI